MNKNRRSAIASLVARLEEMSNEAQAISSEIEALRDEEQEYLDNMPDSLADGDKGSAAQEAVDSLEAAMGDEIADAIREAIDALETASA